MMQRPVSSISPGRQAIGLGVLIVSCFGAGLLGNWVTIPEIPTWYAELAKPAWNPPAWVFAPVWTVLYLMMATAAWLVWRRAGWRAAWLPLGLFALQLVLNSLWTILFFGLQRPDWAAVEIVFLGLAILLTLIAFLRRSALAALLLLPYLAWVGFASVLNWTLWQMNS
jgi:benzodiazapine receptor